MHAQIASLGGPIYRQRSDRASPRLLEPAPSPSLRYSSSDWLSNVLSLPRSVLLRRISFHLISTIVSSACLVSLHAAGKVPAINPLPHVLLGSFLGLLLVFRTNSAYDRFWEGRKHWGSVMGACRSLAIGAVTIMRPSKPEAGERLLALTASFPEALAELCSAGGGSGRVRTAPTSICTEMQSVITSGIETTDVSGLSLLRSELLLPVRELVGALGGCEKLVLTPVPRSYSRHTSRFLTLWCGTLPLALLDAGVGRATIPVVAAVSWCLYGIEEIGHLIELPFDSSEADGATYDVGLPVHELADAIRAEVDFIGRGAGAEGGGE